MKKETEVVPEGYTVIFRRYITLKDGTRRYPPNGQKAWKLVVPVKK